MSDWSNCKNILVIRPDNMGDLLMSTPAIRALRETFGARITVLTSSMAAGVAKMIPEIDEVMVFDLPWVKAKETVPAQHLFKITEQIKAQHFDAAVVFTVYSQNPLPTVMLAYLAEVPRRLAFCRENPYDLLTDWVPDKEPYSEIKHQVRRDLDLVAAVGAKTSDESLSLNVEEKEWDSLAIKLQTLGINTSKPWLILHPGVSEKKREYPLEGWCEVGKKLSAEYQLLVTGGNAEIILAEEIEKGVGKNVFALAGELSLREFILLIKKSPLVISVNTGTIHLAAACGTPIIVLYALTNPQHSPWKVKGKVFPFGVPPNLKSKNEIIRFVDKRYQLEAGMEVTPTEIVDWIQKLQQGVFLEEIPELIKPGNEGH